MHRPQLRCPSPNSGAIRPRQMRAHTRSHLSSRFLLARWMSFFNQLTKSYDWISVVSIDRFNQMTNMHAGWLQPAPRVTTGRTDMKSEIWRWDASATAAAIRADKISSREAVEAALGRLREVNPAVNAVVETLEEEALAAADRADTTADRKAAGPLHGVPVTTKINVDLAGHATTNGLVAMKDALAAQDSAPVAALRRAGAI